MKFGVFVYLVLRCLVGCCTWFRCCAASVGLSISVIVSGTVPGHWLSVIIIIIITSNKHGLISWLNFADVVVHSRHGNTSLTTCWTRSCH